MVDDLPLREATPADIATLVKHRRWMFEDMARVEGAMLHVADLDAMDVAYAAQLRRHLSEGVQRAWVIEAGGQIVASGALLFAEWLARPNDLTERLAYLHSVFTEPEFRRRGLARRIVATAIESCREQGLRRLMLHASHSGRPLYESLGFTATNEMRLVLSE